MRPGYARSSFLLLAVSILLLVILTIFESAFLQTSQSVERLITFFALVIPSTVGAVLGAFSLVRKEGQTWLAIPGFLLNTFFAIFHLLIVLFAG